MGTFLLLIFLFFVVYPLFKIGITVYRVRQKASEFFNRSSGNGGADGYTSGKRRAGWSHTRQDRKKKIDPSVGEYVEFEDIKVPYRQEEFRGRTDYKTEPQVEDAEWEDIR